MNKSVNMKVTFYGTRGSVPVSDRDFLVYGGNTACVLVTFDDGRILILDSGTGIRKLGSDLKKMGYPDDIFIALSHTHWDHIQGFPFFTPVYNPSRNIIISICGRKDEITTLESVFVKAIQTDYFPVPLAKMGAHFVFHNLAEYDFELPNGARIQAQKHNHQGAAFSYRIDYRGKTLAYCTDVEHENGIDPNLVRIAEGADLLIHDAQYTPAELGNKKGWGHSSWIQAVEAARLSGAGRLALFHHDPDHNDDFLSEIEQRCREQHSSAFMAREGMTVDL